MNTEASTISASVTRPSDRTRMSTTAIGASRSRRMIVHGGEAVRGHGEHEGAGRDRQDAGGAGSTLTDASAPRTTSTVSAADDRAERDDRVVGERAVPGLRFQLASLEGGEEADPRAGRRPAEDHRRGDEREVEGPDGGAAGNGQHPQRPDEAEGDPEQQPAGRAGQAGAVEPGIRSRAAAGRSRVVQARAASPMTIEDRGVGEQEPAGRCDGVVARSVPAASGPRGAGLCRGARAPAACGWRAGHQRGGELQRVDVHQGRHFPGYDRLIGRADARMLPAAVVLPVRLPAGIVAGGLRVQPGGSSRRGSVPVRRAAVPPGRSGLAR